MEKTQETPILEKEGLPLRPYQISHFELMFHASEVGDSLEVTIEYSSVLFKKSTIEEFSKCYTNILEQALENKKIKLAEIEISHGFVTMESGTLSREEMDFDF